jgi:exopolyphosphatase / guanosine-5'-triphosphate,3'-diphosphate pyrophosphatase
MRLAAIDVGTNTTRLLIAEAQGGSYRALDRRQTFTRLSEGVDTSRTLAPQAIKRTLAAIAEYCSMCGEFGVERLSVAGTSAVRDARNAQEFLSAATLLAGAQAVALSGPEEARLSFLGATAELPDRECLVFDIGGGSTEFVAGRPPLQIAGRISLDIGAVRLTERYLPSDPPATEEMLSLEAAIDAQLDRVAEHLEVPDGATLIGLGGTVTTLAALSLGLDRYESELVDGSIVRRESMDALYRSLARMPVAARTRMPVLPEGRADVIVAGAAILSRTLARWSFPELLVSEKDILDGLVLQMLAPDRRTSA